MSLDPKDPRLLAAVEEACAAVGIRQTDAFLVKNLVRRSSTTWPACCGSGCDPCSEDLICAALKAKKALEGSLRDSEAAAASPPRPRSGPAR